MRPDLPVVEGKKVMSLERQVRIAAGSLVVIGAAVGQFVHPGWVCSIRVYRSGIGLCRGDRYLRDGDDDCEDALEPGLAISNLPDFHRALGDTDSFLCFAWKASSSSMKEATMGAI